MLDKLTSADFAPHLHATFQLWLGLEGQPHERTDREQPGLVGRDHDSAAHGAPLALELIEVEDLGVERGATSPRGRPFSLIFRGPAGTYLPQRIYSIEHPTLGRLDLFLVPIGPGQGGMCYQVVFS